MRCDQFERLKDGALDARLDREIAALRAPVKDEGLWESIEIALGNEKITMAEANRTPAVGISPRRSFFSRRWPILAPAGVALIGMVLLGIQVLKRPSVPSDLLSKEALARVESTEKEYLGAIKALEHRASPKLAAMDIQMMSLYRDKLAIVDSQIGKCREALDSNPGNAHIRRYLLAALQDKRQTLADVLGSKN